MTHLRLTRFSYTDNSTIGILTTNDIFECFTLEDRTREFKLDGRTAIPAGDYKVILTESPKFKKVLPLVCDVAGFEGVRIHTGNTSDDTEGCIIVGDNRQRDFVGKSRQAFDRLMAKLKFADTIILTVIDTSEALK